MRWIVVFLAALGCVVLCSTARVGELRIHLKKYTNPGGKGYNNHCCDGKWKACQKHGCDHYFVICVDITKSSNSTKRCQYSKQTTGKTSNADTITFSNKIGKTPNPIVVPFDKTIPTSLAIKVDVWDDDTGKDDYVEFLRSDLGPNRLRPGKFAFMLSGRTSLFINTEVVCEKGHYGSRCDKVCTPRGNIGKCDNNGNPVCKSGFAGPGCAERVAPGHCIKGWALSQREKKCYLFSTLSKTWEQAREYCRSYGGDLIAINSFYELEIVKDQLEATFSRRGNRIVWIGLNDKNREGHWTWADGSRVSVHNWRRGEPSDTGNEDCGAVYQKRGVGYMGYWTDVDCGRSLHFICEKHV